MSRAPAAKVRDYNQEDYRKFWKAPCKRYLNTMEQKIIRNMVPADPGWFMDLGCGFGRLVPTYQREDRQLVLVDYAVNLLEMAAENYPQENVHLVAANTYRLPFKDGAFNAGLAVRVFHHMNAPGEFIGELSRTLRAGGSFLFSFSNKRNFMRMIRKPASSLRQNHEAYGDMLFGIHPACLGKLLQENQLKILGTRGTGFFEQVPGMVGLFNRLPKVIAPLAIVVVIAEWLADQTLGRVGLLPLTFARLEKQGNAERGASGSLLDILACPDCRHPDLTEECEQLTCTGCRKTFPKTGRIYDLRVEGPSP